MKKTLLILTAFATQAASAQYQFAPGLTPTTDLTATSSSSTASTASINPSANTGQQSQSGGAGANAAAGAALLAAGMAMMANPATAPMGAALIAMGMMAMAQSGADQNAADQSAGVAAVTNPGATAVTNNNPVGATGTASYLNNPKVQAAQAALTAAGYSDDGTTLTTPSGQSSSTSSLGSESGLSAAGLDPKALAEAQRIAAASGGGGNVAKIVGMGVGEGAGAGAASPPGGAATGTSFHAASYVSPFALQDSKRAQMVAGKTVLFDGEPIGVRGQDIFEMVHTAYNKRVDRGNFINTESGGPADAAVVGLRAPASAGGATATPTPKK